MFYPSCFKILRGENSFVFPVNFEELSDMEHLKCNGRDDSQPRNMTDDKALLSKLPVPFPLHCFQALRGRRSPSPVVWCANAHCTHAIHNTPPEPRSRYTSVMDLDPQLSARYKQHPVNLDCYTNRSASSIPPKFRCTIDAQTQRRCPCPLRVHRVTCEHPSSFAINCIIHIRHHHPEVSA